MSSSASVSLSALEFARVRGVELELGRLGGLGAGIGGLVVIVCVFFAPRGVELGRSQAIVQLFQERKRRRQSPVRQQAPDILVAGHLDVVALVVDGAVALKLVQQQDAGLALGNARFAQHARDGIGLVPARAVAEAVHLHFDKAVVKTQLVRKSERELRLASAGQAPQAEDDGALDDLGQHVPGAHRFNDAVDHLVDTEQLGLQLGGDGRQLGLALGQALVQGLPLQEAGVV